MNLSTDKQPDQRKEWTKPELLDIDSDLSKVAAGDGMTVDGSTAAGSMS